MPRTKEILLSVETLQERMKIPAEIHAGTCARQGWARGKKVTEKEYAESVKQFRLMKHCPFIEFIFR